MKMQVIHQDPLPTLGILLIQSPDKGKDGSQVLFSADLVVVSFDVKQFLLASVFLVEDLGVGEMHEVVMVGSQKDPWNANLSHLGNQLQIREVYVLFQ